MQHGGESGDTGEPNIGDESGDTDDVTTTEADDGDTSTVDDDESGDTGELERLRSELAKRDAKIRDLEKDRDKGIRKRKTLEERVTGLERKRDQDHKRAEAAEKKVRISETADAVLGEMHEDHRATKTAKRVVRALQGEGLDFAAEDRAPIVEKAVELLKEDHPEFFEKKQRERVPVLPKTKNKKVKTDEQGGIRDKNGERLI